MKNKNFYIVLNIVSLIACLVMFYAIVTTDLTLQDSMIESGAIFCMMPFFFGKKSQNETQEV